MIDSKADIVEVMARPICDVMPGTCYSSGDDSKCVCRTAVRDQLTALEAEGYAVVKLSSPLTPEEIESMIGVSDLMRGGPEPAASPLGAKGK